MNIHDILDLTAQKNGSDIHIIAGIPPMLRVDGELEPVEGAPVLTGQQTELLISPLMTQEQKDFVATNKEIDFGYQFKDIGRFRVNVYTQKGTLAASLRLIPAKIRTIEELSLPPVFHKLVEYNQGLILVTGPTGEGKSSTLAAMIDEINTKRGEHILTVEDPIEFVYQPKKSIISQREVGGDTIGWDLALRSALREDPDIVLIGELRDKETISAALTIAETGHLVFGTLHTFSAAQTIDRIIDVFAAEQQGQVRQQLAATLQAVVSQRLLPKIGGGRIAATEVMIGVPAIRNLIREEKIHQIDNVIQTSSQIGMNLLESHLLQLVQQGVVSPDKASDYAIRREEFDRLAGK
jgi:twitching motility protein PilT